MQGFISKLTRMLTTSTKCVKVIPSSKGLPLIGNMPAFLLAGGAPKLHRYIDCKHQQLGAIFAEKLGGVAAVFISDPELMRAVFAQEGKYPVHVLPEAWTLYTEVYGCARGLFFMNGEEWLHNRRLMNNFLLKQTPTGNSDFIKEAVHFVANSFNVCNCEVDLEAALYRWSLDTIVAVVLGRDLYTKHKTEIDIKLDNVSRKIKSIFETSVPLQFVPVRLAYRLRLKAWTRFSSAVDDALNNTSDLVYQLMTLASSDKGHNSSGLAKLMQQARMAPSDIIKILVDLVLAAGDTTAYTMEWMLYLLAKHPKYQTDSDVRDILRETLRLYPVAPFITRINIDHDIVLQQYHVPKHTLLIYSLYTAGRDSRIFVQPQEFLPERWRYKTPQMMQATLPFAMGARSCIGRRIAQMQLETTLQKILRKYVITLRNPEDEIDITLKMISVPSKPINLQFVDRR